jgi:hypothetical protein
MSVQIKCGHERGDEKNESKYPPGASEPVPPGAITTTSIGVIIRGALVFRGVFCESANHKNWIIESKSIKSMQKGTRWRQQTITRYPKQFAAMVVGTCPCP